jgi:hypothetical protein
MFPWNGLYSALQGEVGDDGAEVGVAAPLAIPVYRALHLDGAACTATRELATATSVSLWAWMPIGMPSLPTASSTISFISKEAAAVGAHKTTVEAPPSFAASIVLRRIPDWPCRLEEVFGVVDHLEAPAFQAGDSVPDHGQVFFKGDPQGLGDMEIPRLAENSGHLHPVSKWT